MRRIIVAIFLLLALGYSLIGNPAIAYRNYKLKNAILSVGSVEAVTLNDITPYKWDTVYTFAPYTSRQAIEEIIGFKSRYVKETVSEGMVQLLFVKGDSVVASVCGYADNLGYRVEFSGAIDYTEEAKFSVSKNEGIVALIKTEK